MTPQIKKAHLLDPLPEGYFFNGYEYVSFSGDASEVHPNMAEFVTAFLSTRNRGALLGGGGC
jgi:hypothetical protein